MNARSASTELNNRAAINNEEVIEGLVVSPNPSDGIYSLSFSTITGTVAEPSRSTVAEPSRSTVAEPSRSTEVTLMVTNLSGNVVLKQDFKAISNNVNHVINLRDKPNGEYLISVVFGNKRLSKKVVKIE